MVFIINMAFTVSMAFNIMVIMVIIKELIHMELLSMALGSIDIQVITSFIHFIIMVVLNILVAKHYYYLAF